MAGHLPRKGKRAAALQHWPAVTGLFNAESLGSVRLIRPICLFVNSETRSGIGEGVERKKRGRKKNKVVRMSAYIGNRIVVTKWFMTPSRLSLFLKYYRGQSLASALRAHLRT
jgi:hypothetical protein